VSARYKANKDTTRIFARYFKAFLALDRDNWQFAIDGLVKVPETLTPADIQQLIDVLHQRVRTLRRFTSQSDVRSATQRRAGDCVSPGVGHGSGWPRRRLGLMCGI
jgi:DMSO/TMAO reductase YedYZ molybdopterin-dependent catalytic subunit